MANINEVKESVLKSYNKLKDELKISLAGQVPENYEYFPIGQTMLDVRFADLHIEFASIFDNSVFDYKYNGLNNTIIVNKKYLSRQDINLENLYMDMALNISYYNPKLKFSGFGNETYEALNKGFREMLTISILGETRSNEYPESDEYIYANLLNRMLDISVFWNAFFYNNPNVINEILKGKSIEYDEIFCEVNLEANRSNKVRNTKKGYSSLAEIQSGLLKMYKHENPSKEQFETFISNMVSEPSFFENSNKYERLSSLDFDAIYKDYIESLSIGKSY